jgi:ribose-phosphate pyrophosphokinase
MIHTLNSKEARIFCGRSHPRLAEQIASNLGLELTPTSYEKFSNDNLFIQLGDTVRNRSVFIVQSLIKPVSEHLFELFMMLNAARSAGAGQVHAVIPYFSYARSDKKNAPRISITARLVADLLQTAGATQVLTMTLHSPQVHGFFSIPIDPLTARSLFANYLRKSENNPDTTVVVAPDYGRAGSAARLASLLGLPTISAEKTRISDTIVRVSPLLKKQVEGFRRVILYDDEIATGGSIVEVSKMLIEGGIKEIVVCCTHGVFVRNAVERIFAIPEIQELVTTDTVPQRENIHAKKMTVLPVAPLLADAIYCNHTGESIGNLFAYWEDFKLTE